MADTAVRDAWVKQVLGLEINRGSGSTSDWDSADALEISAARGREAAKSNPRTTAFTTLLLDWRTAQTRLESSLAELADAILKDQEVQADPRFAAVEQAVKGLPKLVPEFGGALETAIDDVITSGDMAGGAKPVLAAVAAYRQRLAAAIALSQLETIASQHLRATPLLAPLDTVLAEIERAVTKAV